MSEAIRLVIWDLDETFWRGTLSEGGVVWRDDAAEIVEELARRGIMSTICSKNDFASAKAALVAEGLWETFIFPSIDWTPKGPRVGHLIETIQLRAASVLFIDDNPLNLADARRCAPGLQTANATVIPALLCDPRLVGKRDAELARLKHYKVLEAREADKVHFGGSSGAESDADFLRASDIRIRIETDIEAHLDRAIELINRTNQLNFVKRRLPENAEAARRQLRAETSEFTTQAGLIEVCDRYGDYGLCGYFQVSTRRDVAELGQFCFSCRVLGMGVEAFVYQRLGRPLLRTEGEVLSDPATHSPIDWIRIASETSTVGGGAAPAAPSLGSVAVRGGCVLWPLVHYFGLSSDRVVGEFNTVREGKLVGLDHSLCLRHAINGVSEDELAAVAPLGFQVEDFQTRFFDYSGQRPIWVFSSWIDVGRPVFRHRRTGMTIPYLPPRNRKELSTHGDVPNYVSREFDPFVYDKAEFQQSMRTIFAKVPSHGLMFVLKFTEQRRRPNGDIEPNHGRRRRNAWLTQAAADHPNVRLISMSDFINDEREILNENLTHFDRKVYHRLYRHVQAEAEAEAMGSTSPPIGAPTTPASQTRRGGERSVTASDGICRCDATDAS